MADTRWIATLGGAIWLAGALTTWQLFGVAVAALLWVVAVPVVLFVLARLCDPEITIR